MGYNVGGSVTVKTKLGKKQTYKNVLGGTMSLRSIISVWEAAS